MTNIYRPPFDPYSQRQEAQDPNPALRTPWDGCWAWTLARAINGTTGGKVTCYPASGNTVEIEDVIRAAAGVPDRAGVADGGTLNQQVTALGKLAPIGTWYSSRPTQAEFRAHLAAGGIAVMAGWEDQAPISDRAYDAGFYDRHGSNGHSVFCQGVGDGKNVYWGNPEKFSGIPEPVVTIDAALKFVWDSQAGGYPRVEALLLNSVEIAMAQNSPTPTPPPGPVTVAVLPDDPAIRLIGPDGSYTLPTVHAYRTYALGAPATIPGYSVTGEATSAAHEVTQDGKTLYLLDRNFAPASVR
jgi:hypothetical protein